MSGGGDEQTTTTQMPPWLDSASQNLLGQAGGAVGAPTNGLQTGAYATAGQYGEMAPGALGQAYNTMTSNANFTPNSAQWLGPLASMLGGGAGGMVQAPAGGAGGGGQYYGPAAQAATSTIDPSQLQQLQGRSSLDYNVADYMNPYTQNVINANSSDIERARQTQGNNDSAAAIGAGAFGGSRSGVVSALTNSEYDRNQEANSANLLNQSYGQAQTAIGADIANQTNADTFNSNQNYQALLANAGFGNAGAQFNAGQSNNLTQTQMQTDAQRAAANAAASASMYGSTMQANTSRYGDMLNAALGMGQLGMSGDLNAATLRGNTATQLQNFGQGGLNAEGGAGDAIRNQPFDDMSWYSGILGNVPHGQSSSTPIQHNRGAGALGGAASGAAMGTTIMPGWGTAIGAGVGGLMGYFGS